ncbi:MAG: glycosyltransferase [Desulforhabdus sp.]|jgi:glycosyltransferase involved in cell wall biosynthesis|nr:glycosyltransferase [Desulforhabdus sp.]
MLSQVSVIIPAYNHERFIATTVDSVLRQTHADLELIVIDDGSTDRTGAIVQAIEDPRIKYLYQNNQDAYNALNKGIALATGDFVAILNSDDVYAPNRLERLLRLQKETNAQCLFTDVIPIDDEGRALSDPEFGWNIWHQKNRDFYFKCHDLYTAFLKGNFMVTTSNLFLTRKAAVTVGPFAPIRYLHDYDYIFRVMLSFPGQVHYLDQEQLLSYRIHSGNTLSEAAIIGREQDREVIKKYLLAGVPEGVRDIVAAGSDRLVELERELYEVRLALAAPQQPGIRESARSLYRAILRKWR